jgi:hypothetical protein
MNVKDFLSPVGIAVDHHPVAAFGETKLAGEFGGHGKDVTNHPRVIGAKIVEGSDVLTGNDHDMMGSGRMDVLERQAEAVLVNHGGGDLAVADLAEETIGHGSLLARLWVSCGRGTGQPVRRRSLMVAMLALLIGLGLAGCKSVTGVSDSDLNGVVKMFHHDLRWKYFKTAAARVDPRYAQDFLEQLEDSEKDLSITEWEIRRMNPSKEGDRAVVRIRIKYFKMPSTVLQDETMEQVWELKEKAWYLVSQEGGPFELPPEGARQEEPSGREAPDQGEDRAPKPDKNESGP